MDRNSEVDTRGSEKVKSLSARRAWIEIEITLQTVLLVSVALRKESVDRNFISCINRAVNIVALRKESVDRNAVGR